MYYTDDSILPEHMAPLIITAVPFGREWLPGDADIPVTWDEQVQAAVDCYNAGATMLHVHMRDPETGHGSVDFDHYNDLIARLKQAVPKMILQVGGSISFSPKSADAKAKWLNSDTRHNASLADGPPGSGRTTRRAVATESRMTAAEAHVHAIRHHFGTVLTQVHSNNGDHPDA